MNDSDFKLLMNKGSALGPELITNGDFSSAVGWTVTAPATISGGKANTSTTAFAFIRRAWDTPPAAGWQYRLTVVVDTVGDCQPKVELGPTWDPDMHLVQNLVLGTNTFDFTVASISDGTESITIQNYAAGTVQAVIDSVSLKRII